MNRYYVKVCYPDIKQPQCPELTAVFMVYAETQQKAAERAWHWGVVVMRDMMRHNGINPYEIDIVAPELVKVIRVDIWKE